jgi:hypothetical protein
MLPKVGLIRPATVRVRSKRLPRQDAARTAAKHSINCELEPPRVCRRPFGLSYAAMAGCSSMA